MQATYQTGAIAPGTVSNNALSGQYVTVTLPYTISDNISWTTAVDNTLRDQLVAAIQKFGLKHSRDCNAWDTCRCGVAEIERLVAEHVEQKAVDNS